MVLFRYLVFFFFCVSSLFSNSLANIVIEDGNEYDNFELFVYEDKNDNLNIEDIRKINFIKKTKNSFSLGRSKGSFWFKLNIKNLSSKEDFILSVNESFYEKFELYDGNKLSSTFLRQKIENRDIKDNKLSLKVKIKNNESKTLYIKLNAKFAYFGNFVLYEDSSFYLSKFFNIDTFFVLLFGIFIYIFIFNIFLYQKLKERIYLYYVGYIFFLFIYIFNISGFIAYFGLSEYLYKLQASSSFALGFLTLFSLKLLDVKKHLPLFNRISKFIAISSFVVGILTFFSFYPWIQISVIIYYLTLVLLILISIILSFRNNLKNIIYAMTISLYSVILIIRVFMIEGLVEHNHFTRYSIYYVTAFEVIIFALILSNRYSELKDEVINTQEALINEKTTNQLSLEKNIKERTKEISKLLEEKNLLLKELHHRVKNNFHMLIGLLWLEFKKKDKNKIDLDVLINRINAMSAVHEQLYSSKDLTNIDIKSYLNCIISNISYDSSKIKVIQNINNISLESENALFLGIILNEILTNIIKHNKKSERLNVNIELKKQNDYFEFIVKDDGLGFNESDTKKGLGLKLIEQFSSKLSNSSSKFYFEKEFFVYRLKFSI